MQKLKGYALQLAGWALLFAGVVAGGAAFAAATAFPQVPLGWFVLGAVLAGAPLMAYGAGLIVRGRGLETGDPGAARKEHRDGTVLLGLSLGFSAALGLLLALPVLGAAVGLPFPNPRFMTAWCAAWFVALFVCEKWTTRPLWRALERRARARWDVTTGATETSVTGAPAPRRAPDGTVRVERAPTSEAP